MLCRLQSTGGQCWAQYRGCGSIVVDYWNALPILIYSISFYNGESPLIITDDEDEFIPPLMAQMGVHNQLWYHHR